PYLAAGTTLRLGASVGTALFPDDGSTPDRLLARADHDMYATKRARQAGELR
ncbi:MAG: hypothetical protein JWN17_1735, partial [Frankiales bacterium]|nr:hypothetical protein [Frankiales bacterium]